MGNEHTQSIRAGQGVGWGGQRPKQASGGTGTRLGIDRNPVTEGSPETLAGEGILAPASQIQSRIKTQSHNPV